MTKVLLPVTAVANKEGKAGLSLHPAFYITSWIFFSNLTILFNKWLIDNAGFRYPVILAFWHMVFASLATQILARTTTWLDGRHQIKMTRRFYLRAILPIGLLYSGSMVCSNIVYLYLNVAFIQMLKAAAPFSTLVVSWLWGQEQPTGQKVLKIVVIVFGVVLASFGEIHFSTAGFIFALGGLIFESLRVVMVKDLMSDAGADMDPMVSLYYYAPICAVTNLVVALGAEGRVFNWSDVSRTGVGVLALNALVAFFLNVSSVMLLGKTSALILHLCGILKNIILVITSVLIWDTMISPIQAFGYSIALVGMLFYKATLKELKEGVKDSLASYRTSQKLESLNPERASAMLFRRLALTIIILVMVLVLFFGCTPFREFWLRSWTLTSKTTQVQPEKASLGWLSRFGYGKM